MIESPGGASFSKELDTFKAHPTVEGHVAACQADILPATTCFLSLSLFFLMIKTWQKHRRAFLLLLLLRTVFWEVPRPHLPQGPGFNRVTSKLWKTHTHRHTNESLTFKSDIDFKALKRRCGPSPLPPLSHKSSASPNVLLKLFLHPLVS